MPTYRHAYKVLTTDFELEPVINQFLSTYPEAQPRKYDIVCRLENERQQGDYSYIIVYEYVPGKQQTDLMSFLKSYCEVHNRVAAVQQTGNVFPDLASANFGNAEKYRGK